MSEEGHVPVDVTHADANSVHRDLHVVYPEHARDVGMSPRAPPVEFRNESTLCVSQPRDQRFDDVEAPAVRSIAAAQGIVEQPGAELLELYRERRARAQGGAPAAAEIERDLAAPV